MEPTYFQIREGDVLTVRVVDGRLVADYEIAGVGLLGNVTAPAGTPLQVSVNTKPRREA